MNVTRDEVRRRICGDIWVGEFQGQFATCLREPGHSGLHNDDDGEMDLEDVWAWKP